MKGHFFSVESEIDEAIALNPDLLNGDGEQRKLRWLFLGRRFPIRHANSGGRRAWEADSVFIDENFILTIVEAKLNDNSEIERTVNGQILDYLGSILHNNPVKDLKSYFYGTCQARNLIPFECLNSVFPDYDEDEIWKRVAAAIELANVRMILASDGIPENTHRTLYVLNAQLKSVQIELLKLWRDSNGVVKSSLLGAPNTEAGISKEERLSRRKNFLPLPLMKVESSQIRMRRDYYPNENRLKWIEPLPEFLFLTGEVTASTKYAHQVDPARVSSMCPVMPNFDLLRKTGNPYPPTPDRTVRPLGQVYSELVRIAYATWARIIQDSELELITRSSIVCEIVESSEINLTKLTVQVLKNHRKTVIDSLLDCSNFGLVTALKRGQATYRFSIGGPNWTPS